MSIQRVNNNFEAEKYYSPIKAEKEADELLFDYNKPDNSTLDIASVDNTEAFQNKNNKSENNSNTNNIAPVELMTQDLTQYLENLVTSYEEQFNTVKKITE